MYSNQDGKSEFAEGIKMKDGKHPNPNTIHPIAGYDKEIYVKPTISLPRHIENGIVPDGFHLTAMPLLFV